MKPQDIMDLQQRAVQIRDESLQFIEACKQHIQKGRSLTDEATRLSEEAMVLKEECIADRCKSLAILKLLDDHKDMSGRTNIPIASIAEDTSLARVMIEEIKQVYLPEENPLNELKTKFLDLSYLPAR